MNPKLKEVLDIYDSTMTTKADALVEEHLEEIKVAAQQSEYFITIPFTNKCLAEELRTRFEALGFIVTHLRIVGEDYKGQKAIKYAMKVAWIEEPKLSTRTVLG